MTASDARLDAAVAADAEALQALEARCHSHPWTLRHFVDALSDRATMAVLVLRRPGALAEPGRGIVAFAVLQVVAGEMHLHDLAVDPDARRRGLGGALLDEALRWAESRGANDVFLEVRRSNWAALELYRKAGFAAVSTRRDYYQQPREDALVLRRVGSPRNP